MRRCLVTWILIGTIGASGHPFLAQPLAPAEADLHDCGYEDFTVLCGSVERHLDPQDSSAGVIDIHFELYPPALEGPPIGTIVAAEGGPGYATTSSADSHLDLFWPLLDRRQLLLVDNRGTGGSAAINCSRLQSYVGDYQAAVEQCGEQLGSESDLWGTALAADDLAAILDALEVEQVDLYGDSYGSFFAQTFAIRHPDRLRTLILDGAYPVEGLDPWSRDLNRALVNAFQTVCERDLECAGLGGDPIDRIRRLADVLTKQPLSGSAHDADGVTQEVYLDAAVLAYLTGTATYGSQVYRELDAAIRAYLDRGDAAPLLRISAEQFFVAGGGDVEEYSEGAYMAVACNDYPQLWNIHASEESRALELEQAMLALESSEPDAFEPFTIEEWYTSTWHEFDSCIGWPTPSTWVAPVPDTPDYPDVPTLVLVGDLDSITPPEGAKRVADNFPNSTYVEVANVAHVTALGDNSRCASQIVLRFVRTGGIADRTSCASRYNEIRMVDHFAETLAEIELNPALKGGKRKRAVIAAGLTVADMMTRWYTMYGEEGVGLRGGEFTAVGLENVTFDMRRMRWVRDLRIGGEVEWNRRTGEVVADLRLSGTVSGTLRLTWNDWEPNAQMEAAGTLLGKEIAGTLPAP